MAPQILFPNPISNKVSRTPSCSNGPRKGPGLLLLGDLVRQVQSARAQRDPTIGVFCIVMATAHRNHRRSHPRPPSPWAAISRPEFPSGGIQRLESKLDMPQTDFQYGF
ncbi:uncharacterized protein VTP21DRAFT_6406 [Calcarisporiella thermophila]|uniref:uncharacterized protein n=1 Tax=Calcarisporiella thermophila TaxID=911321 RepID=UPI00374366AB